MNKYIARKKCSCINQFDSWKFVANYGENECINEMRTFTHTATLSVTARFEITNICKMREEDASKIKKFTCERNMEN